ncbi:PEPxxWA-CTERM sorting domain-containing protein [Sandaracinobacter sp. RS1-74]|uniref:PEPxxWA-CTERM sorting domain-containing protein n=1 Tax=Sandaracinobacteroides sayramensis TaxID=2913411 RepID=UPI001EDBC922|nr:PEPxxWA-CTERM sorting domain-containing protein [Sandaracinobacteroides sayramensis]MCG2840393.1 PEPxxWA-CTERM sorting domain-containing protein [Sandaracinobacteroides sayramensis]
MIKSFVAVAVAVLAVPAAAASFITAPGAPDPGAGALETLVVTFDAPDAAGYSWSGSLGIATGSTAAAAAPAGNATAYGFVSSASNPNWAQLDTPNLKSISFYWGSIDGYNQLEVLGAGGTVLLSLFGNTPGVGVPPIVGDQGNQANNRRIFITAGAGEVITGLRFTSTGVAFEFDDIAASAVPEPATWAMLIAGFGLVGYAARRRRSAGVLLG